MSDGLKDSKSKIHKLPFIIKKDAIKSSLNYGVLFRCLPGSSESLIKEDIIYKAKEGDFLQGKYPALCIINKLDVEKNRSRTIATYTDPNCAVIQLTSDAVVKLIGQANYDQVFTSLCCVINQELKIKGILSLLCPAPEEKVCSAVHTQTYESSFQHLLREKQRRTRHNKRNNFRSYVVPYYPKSETVSKEKVPKPQHCPKIQTVPRRVVINPADFIKYDDIKVEVEEHNLNTGTLNDTTDIKVEVNSKEDSNIIPDDKTLSSVTQTDADVGDIFPEIKDFDEDSNISDVGSVDKLSVGSSFSLNTIENNAKSILNYIDDHIQFDDDKQHDKLCEPQPEYLTIVMADESTVTIRGNPDPFHIASPDILKDLSPNEQKKLMLHQAYLDWKFCLQRDEDDYLPIHTAILNNDVGLLKRQCSILRSRNETVDIAAPGNLTALQMSIFQNCSDCTAVLLEHGADVMVRDDESRTTLHLAAEVGPKHVEAILEHCMKNAREILKENEELWKPELEYKPDEKLVSYLLTQLSTICDNQGYTPLMLASKAGSDAAVQLLVDASPSTINMAMPTCGNTALYLAVGAACTEAAKRGDKSKIPENYKRTVEILVENGADPTIDNHSGSNVPVLLTEFNDITLSYVIAIKRSVFNGYGNKSCDAVMLLKDAQGVISVAEMNKLRKSKLKANIPKVYTNMKTIRNISECQPNSDSKNSNNDTKVVAKLRRDGTKDNTENVHKNDIDKPVILKNLPVITKIVAIGSDKPVLVKGIASKDADNNKGLLTQITAKSKNPRLSPIVKSTSPIKYLNILPKPEPDPVKNSPLIIRQAAVKRPRHYNDNNSAPSSSKIRKT